MAGRTRTSGSAPARRKKPARAQRRRADDRRPSAPRATVTPRPVVWLGVGLVVALVIAAVGIVVLAGGGGGQAAAEARTDREVGALLAGIPQEGDTLGRRTAPVTLEVYADLKDPDSQNWFLNYLPAIIHDDVRTGLIKIQYHTFKTNTYLPQEFVKEQTGALAAGAQNRLWDFVDTFYHEQRSELTFYVTEGFVEHIARQVPGLNLALWHADRHTGRREEQAAEEDQTAKAIGLHVTPDFLIGRTGGKMEILTGRHILLHAGQRYGLTLVDTEDLQTEIEKLT